LLVVGTARFGFDPDEPRPNSLIYLLDTGTGQADWLSPDPVPDQWTSRVLGEHPDRVTLTDLYPMLDEPLMRADAPGLPLPAPTATVVSSTDTDVRTVRFRVTPTAQAWRTQVILPVRTCRFGDTDLPGSAVELYGATSREITCAVDLGAPLAVGVVDHWIGLPDAAAALVGPRPPDTMPVQSGNRPYDAALVHATFQL
jgi:hypothetical protein